MNDELLSAVTNSGQWLPRFTKFEYRKAFEAYLKEYGAAWKAAITQAGEHPEMLAADFLDALEAHVARQRFWNRSVTRIDCRQMAVVYLTPMLLKQGEEAFAELLSRLWAERWPKLAYGVASYETLLDGFVDVILGFRLDTRRNS